MSPLGTGLGLDLIDKLIVANHFQHLVQGGLVVATVVDQWGEILEDDLVSVGKSIWPDIVAPPDFIAI